MNATTHYCASNIRISKTEPTHANREEARNSPAESKSRKRLESFGSKLKKLGESSVTGIKRIGGQSVTGIKRIGGQSATVAATGVRHCANTAQTLYCKSREKACAAERAFKESRKTSKDSKTTASTDTIASESFGNTTSTGTRLGDWENLEVICSAHSPSEESPSSSVSSPFSPCCFTPHTRSQYPQLINQTSHDPWLRELKNRRKGGKRKKRMKNFLNAVSNAVDGLDRAIERRVAPDDVSGTPSEAGSLQRLDRLHLNQIVRSRFGNVNDITQLFVADQTSKRQLRCFVTSWNLQGAAPDAPGSSFFLDWLREQSKDKEVVAIGFQELVELKAQKLLGALLSANVESPFALWSATLERNLPGYRVAAVESQVGLGLLVLVRDWVIASGGLSVATRTVKTNMVGTKGGVMCSVDYLGIGLCFMNVHLPSGEGAEYLKERREAAETIIVTALGDSTISQYDAIFFFGDLNTRIFPHCSARAVYQNLLNGDYANLLATDDLAHLRRSSLLRVFHEGEIYYAPTYKYCTVASETKQAREFATKGAREFEKPSLHDFGHDSTSLHLGPGLDLNLQKACPAWVDRVLYYAPPRRKEDTLSGLLLKDLRCTDTCMCVAPAATASDHKPVGSSFVATVDDSAMSYVSSSYSGSSSSKSVGKAVPSEVGYTIVDEPPVGTFLDGNGRTNLLKVPPTKPSSGKKSPLLIESPRGAPSDAGSEYSSFANFEVEPREVALELSQPGDAEKIGSESESSNSTEFKIAIRLPGNAYSLLAIFMEVHSSVPGHGKRILDPRSYSLPKANVSGGVLLSRENIQEASANPRLAFLWCGCGGQEVRLGLNSAWVQSYWEEIFGQRNDAEVGLSLLIEAVETRAIERVSVTVKGKKSVRIIPKEGFDAVEQVMASQANEAS